MEVLFFLNKDKKILYFLYLVLGVISLFFYVGVEVIVGDIIGLYGFLIGVENVIMLMLFIMIVMVIGYVVGFICIFWFIF